MEIINQISTVKVVVKNGNIATEDVELIVVPEFNSCASYGGVGRAICAAGMRQGMDDYDKKASQREYPLESVVLTESGIEGILLAHVTTVEAKRDDQFMVIFKTISKLMRKCDESGIKSIAIPELGTGVIGSLTQEQAAKAIFGAIYAYTLEHKTKVEEVRLVVYGGSIERAGWVLKLEHYKDCRSEPGMKKFDMYAFLHEIYQ